MIRKKRQINTKYSDYYKKSREIGEVVEKRYNILIALITLVVVLLMIGLFRVQIINQRYYTKELKSSKENIVLGPTAPRGRIYDRNGVLLVDNVPVRIIYYKKPSKVTTTGEIKVAYDLAALLEIDYSKLTDNSLRDFWIRNNKQAADAKIKDEEWQKLEERKLTASEIESLKKERITDEELDKYEDIDREAAYIYYLMNKGYSYSEKIIKDDDVTDEEFALIASRQDLPGVNVQLGWERTYPEGDTLKSILGTVSSTSTGIPSDLKDYYLKKGYSLDDRVGISYLEYQYDDYLKGTKDVYEIDDKGNQILTKKGSRGNDLVLTIDIKLQKEIEKILEQQLLKAKKEANTRYYNTAFAVVIRPKTGEVLAMAGKQIVRKGKGKYEFLDYTTGVITGSVTAGSAVKGASQITGYNNGGLKIGEVRNDVCVKLAATPIKCSWKNLGTLNDLTALQFSSNTYQFYTAMKVAGYRYVPNGAFKMKKDAFKIYRDTFAQFGLGVKTGIDLPNESTGIKGSSDTPGLLLDYSIGQYDTYTPLQLAQYMGTIANDGKRVGLHLMQKIYSSNGKPLTDVMEEYEPTVLNKVKTSSKYIKRVQMGFKKVISGGTGTGYINMKYKPAGKTGTSQSFIDTNNDGKVDKETYTNTFAGYAPTNNPKMAFFVASPNVSDLSSNYTSSVNKRIARAVSDKYFEMYGTK